MSEPNDNNPERRRWVGWLQLGGVVSVLLIAVYFAQSPHAPPSAEISFGEKTVPKVFVVRPTATSSALTVDLTGEVSLARRVEIRSQVTGRVTFVSPAMRNGGSFNAGETLVTIDRTDLELTLEMAHAFADAQRARVRKHELEGELASEAFHRANPGEQVPDIIAHAPQVERFRARLRGALAAVKQAELDLSRSELSLPFAGKVLRSQIAVGDLIGPPAALGTAYTNDAVEISSQLSISELNAIGDIAGRTAIAIVDGKQYDLIVDRIAWERDHNSRLVTVFFKFVTNTPVTIDVQPGSFAELTVRGSMRENVFLLPNSARQLNDTLWYVRDGTVFDLTPATKGRTTAGWLVEAFGYGDGILVGTYPGVRSGSEVEPVVR